MSNEKTIKITVKVVETEKMPSHDSIVRPVELFNRSLSFKKACTRINDKCQNAFI